MDGISSYNEFVAMHKPQLILSGVPEYFWPILCKKLKDQILDAGSFFQLARIDYDDSEKSSYDPTWILLALADIDRADSKHIYLIDHAWTFKPSTIKTYLRNDPGLRERMCNLVPIEAETSEEIIEGVYNYIWKYSHTYAIGGQDFTVEERVPVWYVLDELGSALTHSDNPNFKAVPFIYVPEQMTYTLIYPIENVEEGCPVTRNFVEGRYENPLQREAMLIPWKKYEHFCEDYSQEEPDANYFIEGHIPETLPASNFVKLKINSNNLKVYSEYRFINEYLTAEQFEIVDNEDEADILWYMNHFKNFQELSEKSPHKFVNQFPFEYVITVKDLIAIVSRRCASKKIVPSDELVTFPLWLPTTFNMKTELPNLVSYYMQRKKAGLDNHWICKPYNLARGLDTHITDNLDFLCRLPLSGPKIAQKYIENPVLFSRPDVGKVKFDIRYVILLKSINPTEVYIYNNFFLRFSNKAFAMNNFDDYEQHFTVMNYNEGVTLHRMLCHEFKQAWGEQYDSYPWDDIEKKIFEMFNELFTAAASKPPPCGIANSPQSRALYAADLMLSWHKCGDEEQIIPKLLEVNWMPDCKRACEYYTDFYNDIFSVLFLDKDVETCTKVV